MQKRHLVATLLASAWLAGAAIADEPRHVATYRPEPAAMPSARSEFEAGFKAYERNEFQASLRQFQTAAGHGDRQAQEFLALMYLGGESIYKDVPRSRYDALAWLDRAAHNGSLVAAQTLALMKEGNDGYARYYLGSVLMP